MDGTSLAVGLNMTVAFRKRKAGSMLNTVYLNLMQATKAAAKVAKTALQKPQNSVPTTAYTYGEKI